MQASKNGVSAHGLFAELCKLIGGRLVVVRVQLLHARIERARGSQRLLAPPVAPPLVARYAKHQHDSASDCRNAVLLPELGELLPTVFFLDFLKNVAHAASFGACRDEWAKIEGRTLAMSAIPRNQ